MLGTTNGGSLCTVSIIFGAHARYFDDRGIYVGSLIFFKVKSFHQCFCLINLNFLIINFVYFISGELRVVILMASSARKLTHMTGFTPLSDFKQKKHNYHLHYLPLFLTTS